MTSAAMAVMCGAGLWQAMHLSSVSPTIVASKPAVAVVKVQPRVALKVTPPVAEIPAPAPQKTVPAEAPAMTTARMAATHFIPRR